jgi:hypothetical protein
MGRLILALCVLCVAATSLSWLGCSTSSATPPAPVVEAGPLPTCGDGTRLEGDFCVAAEEAGDDASATTTFSTDVEPILDRYCGVVGCHVPGGATGGLILAPGYAYASLLVDATPPEARSFPALRYVAPGDLDASFLSIKIHTQKLMDLQAATDAGLGSFMPPPQTQSSIGDADIGKIDDWILGLGQ